MVAVDRAHLTGPWAFDDEVALTGTLDLVSFRVHETGEDAEQRLGGGARLQIRGAGQR